MDDFRAMTGQLLPVGICPIWFHNDLEVGGRHRAGIECEETEIDATSKREVSRAACACVHSWACGSVALDLRFRPSSVCLTFLVCWEMLQETALLRQRFDRMS